METMKETNDLESYNINNEIAVRLGKIGEGKGETAYRDKSTPNTFKYMGRKMGVGLKAVGSEVGDIPDDSDYVYTVYLGDVAICDDFRTVLQDMQKEKGIDIEILDYISISDCTKLLGWDDNMPTVDKMIADSGTKFKLGAYQFIKHEADEFSKTGLAFYSIKVIDGEFYLQASNQHLKDMIINKDQNFYYEISRIKTRLTEDLPLKFQEYVEKRRERENNEKNETEKNISNLKNNI